MKRIPLYIDTDMGVDDIAALSMIVSSEKFDIKGISVVNGVSTLIAGVRNLNRILTYMGISCPIFCGAAQTDQKSSIQFPSLDRRRATTLALLPTIPLPIVGTNPIFPLSKLRIMMGREKNEFALFAIGPLTNMPMLVGSATIAKKIFRMTITLTFSQIPFFCAFYRPKRPVFY